MSSIQQDSYNRLITKEQIDQSYKTFKQLLSPDNIKSSSSSNPPSQLQKQILSQDLTKNKYHKTINIDCHRTRSANFSESLKLTLQYVLTYFVQKHGFEYKQGLNEIAAPFVLFTSINVPLDECYTMFEEFFLKYTLNFYYDDKFTGLEMFFKMISIVLNYHCPSLSRYLEVYDIQPQIYAVSWLMTLFSSKLSLQLTYKMWGYMICEKDRYLLFFVVLGIIVKRKNQIIMTQNSSIFKIVTDMIFKNEEELENVIKISLMLRKNTPLSLIELFQQKKLFDRQDQYISSAQLLKHIDNLKLLLIFPQQLRNSPKPLTSQPNPPSTPLPMFFTSLIQTSHDISTIPNLITYTVIDLRKHKHPKLRLSQPHEPYPVDIQDPVQSIETAFLNQYMQLLSVRHFVILLTTYTFQDPQRSDPDEMNCARMFVKVMMSYSFPYLGVVEGGYEGLAGEEWRVMGSIVQQDGEEFQFGEDRRQGEESVGTIQFVEGLTLGNYESLLFNNAQHQLSFSLKQLFQIAELKYTSKLKFYKGCEKTITIVTPCFLIVLQEKQNLVSFISYLEHNCSIVPYFYSNFNSISCKVLKILPILTITQIKTLKPAQTSIIIKFSNIQTQKSNKKIQNKNQEQTRDKNITRKNERPKTIEIKEIRDSQSYSKLINEEFRKIIICEDYIQEKKQCISETKYKNIKKLSIELRSRQQVKAMTQSITQKYKGLLQKRYKQKNSKKIENQ